MAVSLNRWIQSRRILSTVLFTSDAARSRPSHSFTYVRLYVRLFSFSYTRWSAFLNWSFLHSSSPNRQSISSLYSISPTRRLIAALRDRERDLARDAGELRELEPGVGP